MFNARVSGLPESNITWFVVANRTEARVYESDGGVKNFRFITQFSNPQGRLKNREIDSDRDGKASGGSSAFPTHGLVNQDGAKRHVMELFAGEIARSLAKDRGRDVFKRLVLVAEPRFMGELLRRLEPKCRERVIATLEEDIPNLDTPELKEHLKNQLIFTHHAH